MAEAKTAIKGSKVKPPRDVLKRYLQGSMYTTRAMKKAKRSSGGAKKRGKRKISQLPSTVPTDKKGYTILEPV